jgi:transcription elongation GreA/GreB family factor
MKKIKEQIFRQLEESLGVKIKEATKELESLSFSRESETKSSAGDKHETGRAMIQGEIEQQEKQLARLIMMEKQLAQINLEKVYTKVEPGSLVFTNQENYFFSIGIGKIVLNKEIYYAISILSPIGQLLQGREAGYKANLNGRELTISKIV